MSRRSQEALEKTLVPSPRFMLWIDGIDGCLVCLGSQVSFGQAGQEAMADVTVFADISRLHAILTRDSEGYMLEGLRPVQVNGQPAEDQLLQSGDRVTLGKNCQFQFRQPVPVSATAQLELMSGHKLPLAVKKVIMMAETLVMGPEPQAHIVLPEVAEPIVLFRHKDGLGVKHTGAMIMDGKPCRDKAILGRNSRVTGSEFSFALEPLGKT